MDGMLAKLSIRRPAIWVVAAAGLAISSFFAGAFIFHNATGVLPAETGLPPDQVWADRTAKLRQGIYWAGTGTSKITLTLSYDKATRKVGVLDIVGVKPSFLFSYCGRDNFYHTPLISMRGGGFKHGRAWWDIGVKGRLLVKSKGLQSYARWRGKWFPITQGLRNTFPKSFIKFGGQLHRYDTATGGWESVPDSSTPTGPAAGAVEKSDE